ncbi:probable LRR receptor-like serine/threonine-protein kinase At4g29180 [Brassica napus]|uniref:probable LRR receptor-like serine/threonine-protein kinase At4g29180 n=1 Tax=Brassica napus TaxID=3708 RepID=UPI00207879F4|nr:probable LRR receptor-like serine/threonine-protein kinase At4g29180 [Brassica napus]
MRAHRSLFLCLFCALATVSLVHGQSQTGYISIDCGAPLKGIERDIVTGISYTSDDDFITTGVNFNVSKEYNYPKNPNLPYVLADLKAFPQGNRNCYSLKPSDAKDSLYLIRASFMYGNYDGGVNEKALPEFDLYLNVNFWSTVKFKNASEKVFKEILTYTESEFLYVCLVNKGKGTPFISGLELRPVNSSIYNTEYGRNVSLVLYQRWDIGYLNGTGRYQNDVYDRIWSPYTPVSWNSIRTTGYIDVFQSGYSPPDEVIKTAASPKSEDDPMELSWTSDDTNARFYAYLYFAELETLKANESRKMEIWWNGSPFSEDPFISPFEYSTTLSASRSFTGDHLISLQKTEDSTLPPMLNAIEIFTAQSLDEFSTAVEEGVCFMIFLILDFLVKIYILYNVNAVYAIENIKSLYKVKKVWSGDPCAPRLYPWEGVGCIYNNNNHHIKSLNLSSSGLQGPIVMAFRNLSLLESLDLSNNDLQHNVPEFLADLKHLKSLNLKGNNFTGVIPKSLMKKWQEGLLALSVDDKNRCNSSSCQEKKKNNMVVPIAAATSVIVLLVVLLIIWIILRQRKRVSGADAGPGPIPPPGKRRFGENAGPGPLLPSGKRRFTYDEVSSITNNFNKVIGKGGFGIVYLGSLEDGAKIAVKMIKDSLSTIPNVTSSSSSSTRASKEFQTEAELLLTVHHRNLASFVGYCDDERSTALIYEYMANGNLQDYLSSEKAEDLSWEKRLHIAIDAAQGLEYLHQGCRPPIIHRDVKTANILLNDNLEAKIADFGVSKVFPDDDLTHVETAVMGTPGYIDPEYYRTFMLNEKSDVYSFGIVLLELITGQRAIVRTKEGEKISVIHFVEPFLETGELDGVVDPLLHGDYSPDSAWKFVEVAMSCVRERGFNRPAMNQVVSELQQCLAAELAHEPERSSEGNGDREVD